MHPSPYFGPDGVMDVSAFQSAYLWVIILGSLAAFLMAFGIGSNDVANAFGTSVGAKALTFKQAVFLAAIFETLGAALLGAEVADTVRRGIIDMDYFNLNPELLMIAMSCSLFASGMWLVICSALGLPVSTTHSILGALVGLGLTINPRSIHWGSLGIIVLFWFIAPIISGILTSGCFLLFRSSILRADNGPQRAYKSYPIILFVLYIAVVFSLGLKIPFRPLRKIVNKNMETAGSCSLVILTFICIAAGLTAITWISTYRWMKKRMERVVDPTVSASLDTDSVSLSVRNVEKRDDTKSSVQHDDGSISTRSSVKASPEEVTLDRLDVQDTAHNTAESNTTPMTGRKRHRALSIDIDEEIGEDEEVKAIHANAEKFDPKTEEVYTIMMVISACFHSLAHGSNDVANSIGPFAALFYIYREAKVSKAVPMDWWISAGGGIVIAIGLLTYGYKTLMTMGVKLATITPSRGFAIELGATTTILLGSFFKLPLSSTHCSVGSTIGVGLCESPRPWRFEGVNCKLLVRVMWGWALTILFTGLLSMVMFTVISVTYFPRSEAYDCLKIHEENSPFSEKGLISEYNHDAGSKDALKTALEGHFDTWRGTDDAISRESLEKYYPEEEVELILIDYSEGKDSMTKEEWLLWRCYNDDDLLRTTDSPCSPLCAGITPGKTKTSTARCGLVVTPETQVFKSSNERYTMKSEYLVSSCS